MTLLTKKVTIRDLAREAGVSLSTISGVLNGSSEFSEQTRKKVWDIAHSLNYMPNTQARKLRAGEMAQERSKTGIIIHITHMGDENLTISESDAMRSAMLSLKAEKLGLYPITYRYYKLKGFQCPPVINGHIDGAIIGTPHWEIVSALHNKLPLVLLDVPFSVENADVPMVNMDTKHGISCLFNELRKSGHRNIGMMYSDYMPEDGCSLEIPIVNMFREIAQLYNINILPAATIHDNIHCENHEDMMKSIVRRFEPLVRKQEITAIICPSTGYAQTLYENFTRMNIKVPDDISIIGGVHSSYALPPYRICSMRYNWPQLVETALNVLKKLIEDKTSPCLNYLIKPEIYQGTSLKKI